MNTLDSSQVWRTPRSWLSALDPLRAVAADKRGWVRAHQVAAFKRLLPAVALANIANAVILLIVLWDTPDRVFLLVWCAVISLMAATPSLRAIGGSRPEPDERNARAIVRVGRDSALLAAAWAVMLLTVFPPASLVQKMIVAVVMVGMMCGGSFMLATVSSAAFIFSGILCVASAAVLYWDGRPLFVGLALLLLSYFVTLVAGVRWIGDLYVVQLLAKEEAKTQTSLVGMLLHDFQSDASDWLWQLDRRHAILAPSDRFAAVMGAAPSELSGTDLFAHLRPGPEAEALRAALDGGQAFRDLRVAVRVADGERWISFTGHPPRGAQDQGRRGVASDITEQREASARIAYLAMNDPLTRLPNRLSLTRRLEEELGSDRGSAGGLIFVDLDHFKTVNDTLGHPTGDALLSAVARRLSLCAPYPAMVGRLGGDEFAIVAPRSMPSAEVEALGVTVLARMRDPFQVGQHKVYSGCSLGLRHFSARDTDAATVLKHADLALYAAKAAGRGTSRVFEAEMEKLLLADSDTEAGLRHALKRDEFRLLLQPFVDARTADLRGFEALIRWQHPVLGLTSPGEFIDVAVRSGLIDDIGLWVVRQALAQMKSLPAPLSVAVNISATQLASPHFLSEVMRALAHSEMDPSRLEFEITESALLDGSGNNLETLERLAALGVRIALDDFGTGYSSLSHLRLFPFHKIKIDQSFIMGMTDSEDCRSIVNAISGLAASLQMTTTAEGVETTAQLELVRQAGCSFVQGFYYSQPIPLEDVVTRWIAPTRSGRGQTPSGAERRRRLRFSNG